MDLWQALLSVVLAVLGLLYITQRRHAAKLQSTAKLPPHPPTLPLIGDAKAIVDEKNLPFFFSRFLKYGPYYRVSLLGKDVYIVADPIALRVILRDEGAEMHIPFGAFSTLMGSAMDQLAIPHKHAPWRKNMALALGPPALERLFPHMVSTLQNSVEGWMQTGAFGLYAHSSAVALDLSVDVLMGIQYKSVDPSWAKRQCALFMGGLYTLPFRFPGSVFSKALAAKQALIEGLWVDIEPEVRRVEQKVHASRSTSLPPAMMHVNSQDLGMLEAQTTTAMIFRKGDGTDDINKQDAGMFVIHNLVASADTTRVAVFNVLALLANCSRVRDLMAAEQAAVVRQHGEELTLPLVSHRMPYLEAVVKECMRILPASVGSFRKLTKDFSGLGDYTLPAGSLVWWNAPLMHAIDPTLWDGDLTRCPPAHMDWMSNLDAAFRPERWLDDESYGKPRNFYTFGSGTHLCLGMQLVFAELKTLLAILVRRADFSLKDAAMLSKCEMFPYTKPKPGTDTILLTARQ